MRWEFADPDDGAERASRDDIVAGIDAWWTAFAARADDLRNLFRRKAEWNLPQWMADHLQPIDARLMWEYGPALRGEGHRLVITPESHCELRPLVRQLLTRAPVLPGWEFYPYRPPESLADAERTVQGRVGADLAGTTVRVTGGEMRRVDLTFESAAFPSPDDRQAQLAAFVATESLLGEEVLDKWIGAISVEPVRRAGTIGRLLGRASRDRQGVPLDRLRPTVTALIEGMIEQLSPEPLYAAAPADPDRDDRQWSCFKAEPTEREDYPRWSDLFVAVTPWPDVWQAAHNAPGFLSERFSRCGERFCYLKIDGSDVGDMTFADREAMERALDAALVPARAGCTIGGGTGRRYSYIDLALADVGPGVEAVRRVMRDGRAPRRSWLLFYDAEWVDEWVGVWPDSPPPPAVPADGG